MTGCALCGWELGVCVCGSSAREWQGAACPTTPNREMMIGCVIMASGEGDIVALHRDIVDDGQVDEAAWVAAWEAGAPVGFCHVDNGLLLVLPGRSRSGRLTAWEWIGDVRHFVARCVRCHREVSAPNGRVLQRARQDA